MAAAERRPMPLQVAMAVLAKPQPREASDAEALVHDQLSGAAGSGESMSSLTERYEESTSLLSGPRAIPDLDDLLSDAAPDSAETRSIMPLVVAMAVLSRAEAVRKRRTARRAALGGA
ncbi:unnamed protein product [Symbiodinium natans]|uniref:Uncharacterized protein n=1 Tax=Symbiodinium natans TaxID=878477 RepID=A0A812PBA8_9DINO|nr:unnamed protein product [Symbiodinium natans]